MLLELGTKDQANIQKPFSVKETDPNVQINLPRYKPGFGYKDATIGHVVDSCNILVTIPDQTEIAHNPMQYACEYLAKEYKDAETALSEAEAQLKGLEEKKKKISDDSDLTQDVWENEPISYQFISMLEQVKEDIVDLLGQPNYHEFERIFLTPRFFGDCLAIARHKQLIINDTHFPVDLLCIALEAAFAAIESQPNPKVVDFIASLHSNRVAVLQMLGDVGEISQYAAIEQVKQEIHDTQRAIQEKQRIVRLIPLAVIQAYSVARQIQNPEVQQIAKALAPLLKTSHSQDWIRIINNEADIPEDEIIWFVKQLEVIFRGRNLTITIDSLRAVVHSIVRNTSA